MERELKARIERTALLVVLAASPFWLPALPSSWGSSVRGHLLDTVEPLFLVLNSFRQGFSHLTLGLLRFWYLEEENRVLRTKLEILEAHEAVHGSLSRENTRLRQMLDFQLKVPWHTMPAEVLGREMSSGSRKLLLDKGTHDGLQIGLPVINPTGLVGRVVETGISSSRAILITDPHFRIAAKTARSGISGLCTGSDRGECLLTYLPLDAELKPGEMVWTSGGRSFSPAQIPIGVVTQVWKDSSQLFLTARLRPTAKLSSLEEVLVVIWRSSESGSSY